MVFELFVDAVFIYELGAEPVWLKYGGQIDFFVVLVYLESMWAGEEFSDLVIELFVELVTVIGLISQGRPGEAGSAESKEYPGLVKLSSKDSAFDGQEGEFLIHCEEFVRAPYSLDVPDAGRGPEEAVDS